MADVDKLLEAFGIEKREKHIPSRFDPTKHIAIIERHYPKVDEATREAAIADLMQLWVTDIRGGA